MIVSINTDILKKFGITADDFLYLYLLYATSYDLITELELKPNTEALQTKGLVKLGARSHSTTGISGFIPDFLRRFVV